MLRYKFKFTPTINQLLVKLEALRIVFDSLPVLPHVEDRFRRESLLKSSVFSARIEGNPVTLDQAKIVTKTEVSNLLSAYKFLNSSRIPKKLSSKLMLKFHQLVMRRLSDQAGQWRTETGAIFNQAGVAIYLAPPPPQIPQLIRELIKISHRSTYPASIKAAISQFLFEKIHPFTDGNGRVGRLISAYLLHTGGFGFRGLVSGEEFIDQNKSQYYRALQPNIDTTEFVEFFLDSLVTQSQIVADQLKASGQESPTDQLLPRRREILFIIRDHPYCSFDSIARRFPLVNPKTLHYDLKQMQNHGFIIKVGVTRASVYKSV